MNTTIIHFAVTFPKIFLLMTLQSMPLMTTFKDFFPLSISDSKSCANIFAKINSLHPDKTKYLVLSSSQQVQELKTSFFINNNNSISNDLNLFSEISRIFPDDKTPAIKYLGFFFDPNVNFKFHIQSISTKLSIKPS